MRKQNVTLHGVSTMVLSSLLAKQKDGLEYPFDCYQDEPDENGIYQPDLSRLLESDKKSLRAAFSQALTDLGGKYSQSEINTFSQKSNAANAYKSGAATDLQMKYLASLVGSTVDDVAAVTAETERIIEKEIMLSEATANVERAYKLAKGSLVLEVDNTGVILALQEEYSGLSFQ